VLKLSASAGLAAAILFSSAPLAQTTNPPAPMKAPPSDLPAQPLSSYSGTGLPSSDWTDDHAAVRFPRNAAQNGTDTSAQTGKSLVQCQAMTQAQRKVDPDCLKAMKSMAPQKGAPQ
jgi:hypothetical protein